MKVQQVAHLCIFVLFLLSSPALSQEANSQKCIGSEPPPWSIADLRAALPEFKRIYVGRPQGRNLHGIGINHAFALWATIRYVKPLIVIESGVYMGQGTYFIRQAAGPEAAIYCLDPRHDHQLLEGNIYRDTSPRTSYYTGSTFRDFGDLPWLQLIPQHARARTLLVLDDHMSAIKRVQQALGFGFEHIWYEDNSGPDYSFGRMCSRRPVPLRVVYADNFGSVSHNISREEHEANVAYIKRRLKKYYEFPPIWPVVDNGPTKAPLYPSMPPLLEEVFANPASRKQEDNRYRWICYAKLAGDAVSWLFCACVVSSTYQLVFCSFAVSK